MALDDRTYRIAGWGGIALLALSLLLLAALGRWDGAIPVALFLALSILFVCTRNRLPSFFDLLFVLASLVNAAGYSFDLFKVIPYYDDFVHFFTSLSLTLAVGFLIWLEPVN